MSRPPKAQKPKISLEKGCSYDFEGVPIGSCAHSKDCRSKFFRGTVEQVYDRFYVLRTPSGYLTTVNKGAIGADIKAVPVGRENE